MDLQSTRKLVTNKLWINKYYKRVLASDLNTYQYTSYSNFKKFYNSEFKSLSFYRKNSLLNNSGMLTLSTSLKSNGVDCSSASLGLVFDVNFLRKEHMYTKLKYSRSPQYDIVSGGVAALFAGFLGFLVGEKFGLELLDSGDFYIALMYVVLLCLFSRLIFKILDNKTILNDIISFSWLFTFYKDLIILLIRIIVDMFKFFERYLLILTVYVKLIEYVTYINYTFWRVIRFLRYWPLYKF